MLLVNTVNKVHGRRALGEHPSTPQMFRHPPLAQEANHCSHDRSGNLPQASGNCACVIQGGLRQELIGLLGLPLWFRSGEIRPLHFGCQDVYERRCVDVTRSEPARLAVGNHADPDLSLSFWQAGAGNVISNHRRGQHHKDFLVIHQMAPFPVSCTQLMPQYGVLTWIPVWIIVFILVYPQPSFSSPFLSSQKWLYLRCQKLWMSFTERLWIF